MCEYCDLISVLNENNKCIIDKRKYNAGDLGQLELSAWIWPNVEKHRLELVVQTMFINNLRIGTVLFDESVQISYCPMCGRKLVEDESVS